jgi:plasmid stabilization system protein ParE
MARYVLLRRARSDLRSIRDYILRDNPIRAVSFVDELLDRCQLLADNPLMGRARPELQRRLRSFPYGDYLIFYRPSPTACRSSAPSTPPRTPAEPSSGPHRTSRYPPGSVTSSVVSPGRGSIFCRSR